MDKHDTARIAAALAIALLGIANIHAGITTSRPIVAGYVQVIFAVIVLIFLSII